MREPECGAIPPNVGGPIPCHLEPGHDAEALGLEYQRGE